MTQNPPLSVARLETAHFTGWPALATAMDGMWLARFARGYSRRSNSVQSLDPADDGDAAARLARMVDLYLLNDLTPTFRVTPLAGPGVLAALDADGWVRAGGTRVLAMPLDHDFAAPDGVRVSDPTDAIWLQELAGLIGASPRDIATLSQIVGLIACRAAGLLLRDAAGDTVAAALAVNAMGIGIFHNVVTRADRRGRGHGRAVMHAALNWTRAAGATHASLQVLEDNAPAASLYASLGLAEVYRYHYRQPQ